jgi:hypothetical protein
MPYMIELIILVARDRDRAKLSSFYLSPHVVYPMKSTVGDTRSEQEAVAALRQAFDQAAWDAVIVPQD